VQELENQSALNATLKGQKVSANHMHRSSALPVYKRGREMQAADAASTDQEGIVRKEKMLWEQGGDLITITDKGRESSKGDSGRRGTLNH